MAEVSGKYYEPKELQKMVDFAQTNMPPVDANAGRPAVKKHWMSEDDYSLMQMWCALRKVTGG